MNTKLVGEMEKITVFGISLKELQFGGFSTPPKMETTCVPEKSRKDNSLKALFAVYRSTIAKLAGEMEKITGFGIFFGSIFDWSLGARAPIDVHPTRMQKMLPGSGGLDFFIWLFCIYPIHLIRFVWVGVPLLC